MSQNSDLLTEAQMLEELQAHVSPFLREPLMRGYRATGNLPMDTLKNELYLVPVRMWKRFPCHMPMPRKEEK